MDVKPPIDAMGGFDIRNSHSLFLRDKLLFMRNGGESYKNSSFYFELVYIRCPDA